MLQSVKMYCYDKKHQSYKQKVQMEPSGGFEANTDEYNSGNSPHIYVILFVQGAVEVIHSNLCHVVFKVLCP